MSIILIVVLAVVRLHGVSSQEKDNKTFVFHFDNDAEGWTGGSDGEGTFTATIDAKTRCEGAGALQLTYSGNTKYTLYGANVEALKPGDLLEYWVYIPNHGIQGLSMFSVDANGVKDTRTVYTPNMPGLVLDEWIKITYRMNAEATAPFASYGMDVLMYQTNSASFWLDEVKISTDEIKTAPTVPGLNRGVSLDQVMENATFEEIVLKDPSTTRYEQYLQMIKAAGFDYLRLTTRPFNHTVETAPYTIDEAYLKSIDRAVDKALAAGLKVILDMHGYPALENGDVNKEKLLALWEQLAPRYSEYANEELYFGMASEPRPSIWSTWNQTVAETLAVIRKTNRQRQVIVPTLYWNTAHTLNNLKLPEADRNLIVAIHFYEPAQFTSQGAEWQPSLVDKTGIEWNGTDKEKYAIADVFDAVAEWAISNDRPVLVEEFGTYLHGAQADRVRWTTFVRETLEERNIAWGYWEFNEGFGIYIPWRGLYNMELLGALIPEALNMTGAGITETIKPYYGN
jgi:endoglucanase